MRIIRAHLVRMSRGNGNPLQYSCLENPMGRGAWWAAVCGVAKSQTRLNDFTFTFHFHALEKEMAAHSSVLAWGILGRAETGGLPSMGVARSRTRLKQLSSRSSQAEEREEYSSHSWDVQEVLAVVEACPMLLQSEVGRALSQRKWPQVVGPQEEPSCTGSQEGVGSNLCLFTTWWLLWWPSGPPLRWQTTTSLTQLWHSQRRGPVVWEHSF